MAYNTYTSPAGAGTQGTSQQRFLDVLNSITGVPKSPTQQQQYNIQSQLLASAADRPAIEAAKTQELTQNAQLPQMAGQYGDEAKLMALFSADQNLAAKYSNPNANPNAGMGVPTAGSVGVPNTPSATVESLSQPFAGFTTPQAVTSAIGSQKENILSALRTISDAISYQSGEVQKQVTANSKAYDSSISALSSLASMFGQMYQNEQDRADKDRDYALKEKELNLKYFGGGNLATDSYVEQVKGGLNLSSVPQDIRNSVVTELTRQGYTMDKINKIAEGKVSIGVIDQLKKAWDDAFGETSGLITGPLKTIAGYSGLNSDALLYSRFKNAITSTLRNLVGEKGILSNQDMIRIQSLTPAPWMNKETADKNWSQILQLLNTKYGNDVVSQFAPNLVGINTTGGTQTTLIQGPDGQVYEIPNQNVSAALSAGGRLVK